MDDYVKVLNETLDLVAKRCNTRMVAVVTRDGNLVTARGDTEFVDPTSLAALLGAMFSATREVARMVGEKHFSILLQQGEERHIHISLVSENFMVACVFEDIHQIGNLRLQTRKHAKQIAELASIGWQRGSAKEAPLSSGSDVEFREYALDLVDKIFSQ